MQTKVRRLLNTFVPSPSFHPFHLLFPCQCFFDTRRFCDCCVYPFTIKIGCSSHSLGSVIHFGLTLFSFVRTCVTIFTFSFVLMVILVFWILFLISILSFILTFLFILISFILKFYIRGLALDICSNWEQG